MVLKSPYKYIHDGTKTKWLIQFSKCPCAPKTPDLGFCTIKRENATLFVSLQIFLCLSQNFCLHLWHKTTMFKCQLCYQKWTVPTLRVQPLILLAVIDVLFAINSELFCSLSFFPETTLFIGSCRPWNDAVLASLALLASSGGAVHSVLLCQDAARGAKQHQCCSRVALIFVGRAVRLPPRGRGCVRRAINGNGGKKKDDRVGLPKSQLQRMSENNLKLLFFFK